MPHLLLFFLCVLQLMPETLYLTCNIIDRYLSIRNVTRKRLQLVSALLQQPHQLCRLHRMGSADLPRAIRALTVCSCVLTGGRDCHAHCLQVRGDLGARGK